MSIEFKCSCGKSLSLKDETAGLKEKCPDCGATIDLQRSGIEENVQQADEPGQIKHVSSPLMAGSLEEGTLTPSQNHKQCPKGRTEENKRTFYSMIFGLLLSPRETLQLIPYQLRFRDILIYTILFYFVSLLVTGVVARDVRFSSTYIPGPILLFIKILELFGVILTVKFLIYIFGFETSLKRMSLIFIFISGYLNFLKIGLSFITVDSTHNIKGFIFFIYQSIIYMFALTEALAVDIDVALFISIIASAGASLFVVMWKWIWNIILIP